MICLVRKATFFLGNFWRIPTMDERPSCGYHLTKPTVMWDHFGTTCLQPMKLLKVGKVLKTIENVLVCHETWIWSCEERPLARTWLTNLAANKNTELERTSSHEHFQPENTFELKLSDPSWILLKPKPRRSMKFVGANLMDVVEVETCGHDLCPRPSPT
jgi:hypothetical protein